MSETSRIEFKINNSKQSEINNILSSAVQFDSTKTSDDIPRELIYGLDNGEIRSSKPSISKSELSIPVQPNTHHDIFKRIKTFHKFVPSSDPEVNSLNNDLKQFMIEEAKASNEAWKNQNENETIHVHSIKQETQIEEKDVENADYDQVPIEEFGMAAIRGMGYKENSYFNITNKKRFDIFDPEIRPRGLGLGADRKVLENINKLKRNLKESGIDENDDLYFTKGAFVLIEKGFYRNLYGTIESIDEDLNRINVILAINNPKNESTSISKYNVRLITEKEFLKYSKYINEFPNEINENFKRFCQTNIN